MSNLYIVPQVVDAVGGVVNATAEFFQNGTTAPLTVYSDAQLTASLGSQITADATGRFTGVYMLESIFRLVVKVNGVTLYSQDDVSIDGSGNDMVAGQIVPANTTLRAVGNYWYHPTGATAPDPLTEASLLAAGFVRVRGITPELYGAIGDGVANDTASIVAASAAAVSADIPLRGTGVYLINSDITISASLEQVSLKVADDVTVVITGKVNGSGKMFDESLGGFISIEGSPSNPEWWGNEALSKSIASAAPKGLVLEPLSILPSIQNRYVGANPADDEAMDARYVRHLVRDSVRDLGITFFFPFYLEYQTYSFAEGLPNFFNPDYQTDTGDWYRFFNPTSHPRIIPFDFYTVLLSEISKYRAKFIVPTDRAGDVNFMNDITTYLTESISPTTAITFSQTAVGTGVTCTSEFAAFLSNYVGYRIYIPNGGYAVITEFIDGSTVTVEIKDELSSLTFASGDWGIASSADPLRFGQTIDTRLTNLLTRKQQCAQYYYSEALKYGVEVLGIFCSSEPDHVARTAHVTRALRDVSYGGFPAIRDLGPMIISMADPVDMVTDPASADTTTRQRFGLSLQRAGADIHFPQDGFGAGINFYTHASGASEATVLAQVNEHFSEHELSNRQSEIPSATWRNAEAWRGDPAVGPAYPGLAADVRTQFLVGCPYVDAVVINPAQMLQFPNTPFTLTDVQPSQQVATGEYVSRAIALYELFKDIGQTLNYRAELASDANYTARYYSIP